MIDTTDPAHHHLRGVLAGFEVLDDQDLCDTLQDRTAAHRRAEAEDAAFLRVLHERIVDANLGYLPGACAEIGLMLGISTRSAEFLVERGYELTSRPVVWQALFEGLIDSTKARKIITILMDVPDPERTELERAAVGYAQNHTSAELHRKLVRMTCDEDPKEKQRREAIDRRCVTAGDAGHGMAWISIYTSVEHANAFMAGLDRLIESDNCPDPYGQGVRRTREQRRTDALIGFLEDHSFWDVSVQVVIPADMLVGVETKGANLNGSPITRSLALHLAWSPDARWTRLVTDPLTGVLLDTGSTKYEIPKKLRNAVRLRDTVCRFPHCTLPAEYTDTDHVIRYADSGKTDPTELACLCRVHHRIKTFENWHLTTQTTFGQCIEWVGPFGTRATTRPHDYRPSTTKHTRRGRIRRRD